MLTPFLPPPDPLDLPFVRVYSPRYSGETMRLFLPEALDASVRASVEQWTREDRIGRLWRRDASLWTGGDEAGWLGWLDLDRQRARVERWHAFARDVRSDGFTDALLLGMGGSSLAPAVFAATFDPAPGFPRLRVLDSIDPVEVRRVESSIDLRRALVVVSSKSGTTIETDLLLRYFRARLDAAVGPPDAARHLVAVTDAASPLADLAARNGFRAVFTGDPDIGGRFSALSPFGLVPAAILGLDATRLVARAAAMAERCRPSVPVAENPGAHLGLVLAAAARSGGDKVTVVVSPSLGAFGAWAEQLLAESTGKAGRGLVPVVNEPIGSPDTYGDDRLFVYVRDGRAPDPAQDSTVLALAHAGHPVVQIDVGDREDLASEFFRWALATAVAGAELGVHPFDQPDVEASKVAARRWTEAWESSGAWAAEDALVEDAGLRAYAAPGVAAGRPPSLARLLQAHLDRLAPGRYFALLAFLAPDDPHLARLQTLRRLVRDRRQVATSLGFGPRYLHSTGQLHKGGPPTGVFLMLTADPAVDLPVPGRRATFGAVLMAQARGDFDVLASRGRPIVRIHLGRDPAAGLDVLVQLVADALS